MAFFISHVISTRETHISPKYRCLLLSSVTVIMDYEENMENARYATNDDTPL